MSICEVSSRGVELVACKTEVRGLISYCNLGMGFTNELIVRDCRVTSLPCCKVHFALHGAGDVHTTQPIDVAPSYPSFSTATQCCQRML